MDTIALLKNEILWNDGFLGLYKQELGQLYANREFMRLIEEIRAKTPKEETAENIREIKNEIKNAFFHFHPPVEIPALNTIVTNVVSRGCAKNSAYISVYFAMRLYALDETMQPSSASVADKVTPQKATQAKCTVDEVNFRQKWPSEYRCEDGHYVRSKNEALVDNWLYHHSVCHAYEKAVFSPESNTRYCSDFYIPDKNLYIEIWGMDNAEYNTKRQAKIQFYRNSGLQLLQITGEQVKNLDDVLSSILR